MPNPISRHALASGLFQDLSKLVLGSEATRVAPTFGRLCMALEQNPPRPNVGAAQPCEAIRVCLWRKRTDNWPILTFEVATSVAAKSRCYPVGCS